MRLSRGSRGGAVAASVAVALALAGCSVGESIGAGPPPSPTPSIVVPPPLDFNARAGSNRLAALAALEVGRLLYAQGQYWEVYVRTTPVQLPVVFDVIHPSRAAPAGERVSTVEMVLATESGVALKLFSQGGVEHEKAEIMGAAQVIRAAFPNVGTISFRVFYGESFQHSSATFHDGILDYKVAAR